MSAASPFLLIVGDTIRCPELRHELPVALSDAVLFIDDGSTRLIVVSPLDAPAVRAACPAAEVLDMFALGMRELLDAATSSEDALLDLWLRTCQRQGADTVLVPAAFPLAVADHLRAGGIAVTVDQATFNNRRRSKTPAQLAGVQRAVHAAEAALAHVAERLRSADPASGVLRHNGLPLTSEALQAEIRSVIAAHDATLGELVVAHGPQSASGHGPGSGSLMADELIVVDLWPQDRASGCHADVARTFLVGRLTDEIRTWHEAAVDAREQVLAAIGPGVTGRALWELACSAIEARGVPTSRTSPYDGEAMIGFQTALGHGVGLELHESPTIGERCGPLAVGDVIAVEPFICHPDTGAVHLEDIVVVESDGGRCLTSAPTALIP